MIPQAAEAQYRRQQRIAAATAASALKLWRRLGVDFSSDWVEVRPQLLNVWEQGRAFTVESALPYTAAVLRETGQDAPASGEMVGSRFVATAPDGRPLSLTAEGAIITARQAVKGGAPVSEALAAGGSRLTRDVLTVLGDTRRQVYHADIIRRPKLTGYVRMLNPPSCARCVVLAGKHFAWNSGFLRHPRCDCIHIPASESVGDEFVTNPEDYFNGLSKAEQDATFTKSGARAIRDGADIGKVVNRSGLQSALATRAGGRAARLTVDDIYRVAGTRTNAIRLLEQEGYIRPSF